MYYKFGILNISIKFKSSIAKLNNNFNVTQSNALLLEASIKNKIVFIGPYLNFNYFNLEFIYARLNQLADIYRIGFFP